MNRSARVLVLEDDDELRAETAEALADEAFEVEQAATVGAFWEAFEASAPDIVLMDMNLPDGRGLDVARQVRARSDLGIVFLSGRQDEVDRVLALEVGADDFVVKPCGPRELIARLNAVLRRTAGGGAAAEPVPTPEPVDTQNGPVAVFAGFRLDLAAMELRDPDGVLCPLTTAEFDLLSAFVDRPQRVLGRDQLLDLIRGEDWAGYDRTVDGLVSRLRRKLTHETIDRQILRTVRGAGYMFTERIAREGISL